MIGQSQLEMCVLRLHVTRGWLYEFLLCAILIQFAFNVQAAPEGILNSLQCSGPWQSCESKIMDHMTLLTFKVQYVAKVTKDIKG